MYKTKEQAYRQLNFDLVVARADKLLEQRNELVEQLYGSYGLQHGRCYYRIRQPRKVSMYIYN